MKIVLLAAAAVFNLGVGLAHADNEHTALRASSSAPSGITYNSTASGAELPVQEAPPAVLTAKGRWQERQWILLY